MQEFAHSLLAQADGSFWMPPRASTSAGGVDHVFYLVYGISLFFFVLIVVLMLLFVVRYRARPGHKEQKTTTHSTALELTWTVIPLALVIIIFATGFKSFMDLQTIPSDAYEIGVVAKMWNWTFTYTTPDGVISSSVLHVPVDRPIRLVMRSEDVIHSLYIPAFRQKMDVIPGRYRKTWFRATKVGEYDLFCAEYCGAGHSNMVTKVVVHEPGEFEKWLAGESNWVSKLDPVTAGKYIVVGRPDGTRGKGGCTECHYVDQKGVLRAPSLMGIFGHEQTMTDGEKVMVDENYIRQSILDPNARIVAGFKSRAVMPSFKGLLSDEEIDAVIAYIKSLSDKENAK